MTECRGVVWCGVVWSVREVLAAPETAFLHGLVFPVSVQYRCVCLAVKHGSVLSQRALPMVGVLHIVLRSYACLRPSRVDG